MADGEGEGTAALTPAATTPCRGASKAWISESDRPRAARPLVGAGPITVPLPQVGPTPLSVILVWGGLVLEEEAWLDRGFGVDEECNHPPQCEPA